MASSEYYVDPSIAANTGSGTIGDPYGDLQYALDSVTRNTTDGDRFNIKAGTAEVLSAPLSFTTYGTPHYNYPTTFQGYTSAADDGGVGAIDCNGGSLWTMSGSGVCFIDLDISNGPSSGIGVGMVSDGLISRCYIHGFSGTGIEATSGTGIRVIGNRIENVGGTTEDAIYIGAGVDCAVIGNWIKADTNEFRYGIYGTGSAQVAINNIISCAASGKCIYLIGTRTLVMGNSTFCHAGGGTGWGIYVQDSNAMQSFVCVNNIAEGFSGAGGIGIRVYATTANSRGCGFYGNNAAYNNTTNFLEAIVVAACHNIGDNEVPSASPFAKSGANTFANRFVYFAPADTGNVRTGGWPES